MSPSGLGLWIQTNLGSHPRHLLTTSVTLAWLFNLSEPPMLHLEKEIIASAL